MLALLRPVALFAIGTLRVWCPHDIHQASRIFVSAAVLIAAILLHGSQHATSILFLVGWHPITCSFATTWTDFGSKHVSLPRWVLVGPLGRGCSKVVEVVLAALSWWLTRGKIPLMLLPKIGSFSYQTVLMYGVALICCSVAVNFVLGAWSKVSQSRGEHEGLEKYSKHLSSTPTLREEVELLLLAAVNASCEECTSRGFWRHEFAETAALRWAHANIAQALVFGAWHFHGVPSGWSGVGLTFLYGLLMGWFADWTGGCLLLPILTHTVADYYIFSVIMRRKLVVS